MKKLLDTLIEYKLLKTKKQIEFFELYLEAIKDTKNKTLIDTKSKKHIRYSENDTHTTLKKIKELYKQKIHKTAKNQMEELSMLIKMKNSVNGLFSTLLKKGVFMYDGYSVEDTKTFYLNGEYLCNLIPDCDKISIH